MFRHFIRVKHYNLLYDLCTDGDNRRCHVAQFMGKCADVLISGIGDVLYVCEDGYYLF